jgi:hypothetical protein
MTTELPHSDIKSTFNPAAISPLAYNVNRKLTFDLPPTTDAEWLAKFKTDYPEAYYFPEWTVVNNYRMRSWGTQVLHINHQHDGLDCNIFRAHPMFEYLYEQCGCSDHGPQLLEVNIEAPFVVLYQDGSSSHVDDSNGRRHQDGDYESDNYVVDQWCHSLYAAESAIATRVNHERDNGEPCDVYEARFLVVNLAKMSIFDYHDNKRPHDCQDESFFTYTEVEIVVPAMDDSSSDESN